MTAIEIEDKFRKLSVPILGKEKVTQVTGKINNLQEIQDLNEITQILR